MGTTYASVEDIAALWRALTADEQARAAGLLESVSAEIRLKAKAVGRDFDLDVADDEDLALVAKSVCVDTVGRILSQSVNDEPMSQMSQSALGYTVSGTYLVPGGGSLLLKRDLKRLGLLRQRMGVLEIYDCNKGCSGASDG